MKIEKELITFTIIAILLSAGLSYYYLTGTASGTSSAFMGVPLDDTYIHFQYAKNFAEHGKFYYNVGDEQTGATSPLWVIILAAVYKLGFDLIIASKMIGGILHIATAILFFIILNKYVKTKWIAWLGGIFYITSPTLVYYSLSGMDTQLFIFFVLTVFFLFINKRHQLAGVALGLSILARPEGLILFGFLGIFFIIYKRKEWKDFLKMFAIALIIATPWFLYCLMVTGKPLPTTFYAKTQTEVLFNKFSIFLILWPIHEISFSLIAMLFMGIYFITKGQFQKFEPELRYFYFLPIIYFAIFAIFPQAQILPLLPGFNGYCSRYLAPMMGFLIMFIILGIEDMIIKIKGNGMQWKGVIYGILIFTVIYTLISLENIRERYSWDTYNIDKQLGESARWVTNNIPENTRIGVIDAGAVIYFSTSTKNHTIIDLYGLNRYQKIGKDKYEYIKEENIDYLVIYAQWVPDMEKNFYLDEIKNFTLEYNTITGTNNLRIFKITGNR